MNVWNLWHTAISPPNYRPSETSTLQQTISHQNPATPCPAIKTVGTTENKQSLPKAFYATLQTIQTKIKTPQTDHLKDFHNHIKNKKRNIKLVH
jgi:hypothetical protein